MSVPRRVSIHGLAIAVAVAVAVWSTWPLGRSYAVSLPIGCEHVATVPLLNLWTVWWNADRAAAGYAGVWDAPIFAPTTNAFVFSETQFSTVAVAPLIWLTGNPVLAYNVYLLALLSLNGYVTFAGLRRWQFGYWPAGCAGLMVEVLPFLHWQSGVLQLLALWPAIWTIVALAELVEQPGWCRSLECGLATALTYLTCHYYGLFLILLAGPALLLGLLCHWRAWRRTDAWLAAGLGLLLLLVLTGPLLLRQRAVSQEHGWHREWELVVGLSAHLQDFWRTPWPQWLKAWEGEGVGRHGWTLGCGLIKSFAALFGTIAVIVIPWWFGPKSQRLTGEPATTDQAATTDSLSFDNSASVTRAVDVLANTSRGADADDVRQLPQRPAWSAYRRWMACWLAIGLPASCYALGAGFELWNLRPYHWLWEHVPGFGQIRSPFRFAAFVQLSLVMLAALSLEGLDPRRWLWVRQSYPVGQRCLHPGSSNAEARPWRERLAHAAMWLPTLLLGSACVCETLPGRQVLEATEDYRQPPGWVRYLREETPAEALVVCLPFVKGKDVGDYEPTARWMVWTVAHRRRLVNGYSGFYPAPFLALKEALLAFPPDGYAALSTHGVRYAVVDRDRLDAAALAPLLRSAQWHWLYSDPEVAVDIYAVPANPPATLPPPIRLEDIQIDD